MALWLVIYGSIRRDYIMKLRNRLFSAITLIFGLSSFASAQPQFYAEPVLYYGLGTSSYTLEVMDATAKAKSKLEFPYDAAMAGISGGWITHDGEGDIWRVSFTWQTNLVSESGKMKDYDWYNAIRYPYFLFSYTESEVNKRINNLELRVARRISTYKRGSVHLLGGLRYIHMTQDIYGLKGWQIDINDEALPRYELDLEGHFLYYKVTYIVPYGGIALLRDFGKQVSLNLNIAVAYVSASDYDDHLERNKIAEGKGTGAGLISAVELEYFLPKSDHVVVTLFGDFDYFRAFGTQRQEWYGDDPISPDVDDTGRVIDGIDYEFSSWRLNFGLKIAVLF